MGCNVNAKNHDGNTALHQAMMRDNVDMIKLLLKSGADPEIFNDHNETPIFYASNRILKKFSLKEKKACLLADYRQKPEQELEKENKRIKLNLKPKRTE